MGINLIRHLEARGYALASLDVEDFDYPERDRVEIIKGDIREKALVNMAMEGVDHVIHTSAALPLYSPEDIHTTDVEGTRNVLDAAWFIPPSPSFSRAIRLRCAVCALMWTRGNHRRGGALARR